MENKPPMKRHQDADATGLRSAYRYCASLTQRYAGNFRYAFRFLPNDQRNGIYALYSFCRLADDATDDGVDNPAELLNSLEGQLDGCYRGMYNDELTLALADTIHRFDLDRIDFKDMLTGMRSDLTVNRYDTFSDLEIYCYRVASTVGLHCIRIFGADNEQSRLYARNLGIAMQLTNILRDVKEDFDRGRIYIPQEDLKRFDLVDESLFVDNGRDKLNDLIRWEAKRVENYFRKAEETLPAKLSSRLFVARIIGAIYQELLRKIERAERHDQRIELSHWEKLHIACRAMLNGKSNQT